MSQTGIRRNIRNRLRVSTASLTAISVALVGFPPFSIADARQDLADQSGAAALVQPILISCAREILRDDQGRVQVEIPGSMVTTTQDGSLIIIIDSTCVKTISAEASSSEPAIDEYAEARKTIAELTKRLEEQGLEKEKVEAEFAKILASLKLAEETGTPPKDALVEDAEEDSKSDEDGAADLAMMGAMVAACMAVSAGACAAIVALAPSLFGTETTSEEVKGVAQAAADIAAGRPINPMSRKLIDEMATREGVSPDLLTLIREVENGDYTQILSRTAREVNSDAARNSVQLLQEMASGKAISCESVLKAAGGKHIKLDSTTITSELRKALDSSAIIGFAERKEVEDCFDKVFIP